MPLSVRLNWTSFDGGVGETAGAGHRLVAGGHLRRRVDVEVALLDEPGDELVEQLGELLGALAIVLAVAAERLEHLGGELPALHQRVEDRLAQRVDASDPARRPCRPSTGSACSPPANPDCSRKSASLSSSDWRSMASAISGLNLPYV